MGARVKLVDLYNNRDNTTSKDIRMVNHYAELHLRGSKIYIRKRQGLQVFASLAAGEGRFLGEGVEVGDRVAVIGAIIYVNEVEAGKMETSTGRCTADTFKASGSVGDFLIISDKKFLYAIDKDNLVRIIGQRSPPFNTLSTVTGVTVTFAENSCAIGAGDISYIHNGGVNRELNWKAFGDTAGPNVVVDAGGYFDLESNTAGNKIRVFVDVSSLPGSNQSESVTIDDNANFPESHVAGIQIFDSYACVMDSRSEIYNAAVDNPFDFSNATFRIRAELEYDEGLALGRYLNYLIAFGSRTTELFWDAANESGSPFARVLETSSDFGCTAGDSVTRAHNTYYWIGSFGGFRSVYKMEGLAPERISTPAIDRLLSAEQSGLPDAFGYSVNVDGHNFYLITLKNTNRTLVYDDTTSSWHEWTTTESGVETYFKQSYSFDIAVQLLYLHESNGTIYQMLPTYTNDYGNPIKVLGITDKFDNNNNMTKFHSRLEVVGDITSSAGSLGISWSDDDYNTYSTERTVDLAKARPRLTRLGAFERRAFKLTFEEDLPLRLEAFEFDVQESTGYTVNG